jgi:hypothetical protein
VKVHDIGSVPEQYTTGLARIPGALVAELVEFATKGLKPGSRVSFNLEVGPRIVSGGQVFDPSITIEVDTEERYGPQVSAVFAWRDGEWVAVPRNASMSWSY